MVKNIKLVKLVKRITILKDELSYIERGRQLIGQGLIRQALEFFQKALKYYGNNDKDIAIIIKIELGWLYLTIDDFFTAKKLFLQLLEEVESKDSPLIIDIYYGLSYAGVELSELEQAYSYIQQGQALAFKLNNDFRYGWGYYFLGNYYYAIAKMDLAIKSLSQCIDLIRTYEKQHELARALNLLGICLKNSGNFTKALEVYHEALTIYESLLEWKRIATLTNNISIVLMHQGEYTATYRLLKKVEFLAEEQRELSLLFEIKSHLADLLILKGELHEAKHYADYVVTITRKLDSKHKLASALGRLGDFERQLGNLENAEQYFEEAIGLLQQTDIIEANISFELVEKYVIFLMRIGEHSKAEHYINEYEELLHKNAVLVYSPHFKVLRGLLEWQLENRGTAIQLFNQALKEALELHVYEIQVRACLFSAEIQLELFQLRGKHIFYTEAMGFIEQAYSLAGYANLYPDIASVRILRGLLAAADFNFNEAIILFDQVIEWSINKGFKLQQRKAEMLKNLVIQQKSLGNYQENLDKVNVNSLLFQNDFDPTIALINTIKMFYHQDFSQYQFDAEKISIIVYLLTPTGPEPKFKIISNDLEKGTQLEELLTILGTSLSFLIGAGQSYTEGLFGPLPVPRLQHQSAMAFTKHIKDIGELTDPRWPGMNYCLSLILYPKDIELFFFDRKWLLDHFEHLVGSIIEFKQKKQTFLLTEWRNALVKHLQQQFQTFE